MNRAYRDLLQARIAGMLAEAKAVRGLSHHGVVGALRELLVRQLLVPFLPPDTGIASGVLISSDDRQSRQCDLIIYSKRLLPPALLSTLGMVPVEAALFTVEVKSTLTSEELQNANAAALEIETLTYLSGEYVNHVPINHNITKCIPLLFAFGSNLSSPEAELSRIRQLPLGLHSVCVVGSGHWFWSENTWSDIWSTKGPGVGGHGEVLGFLTGIYNEAATIAASRRSPHLGDYFW